MEARAYTRFETALHRDYVWKAGELEQHEAV